MNLKPIVPVVVGFAVAAFAAGCSSGYTKTQVKITMDGAPVSGATVSLVPIGTGSDSTVGASGLTDANGVCSLAAPNKSGVAKGKYRVTVVKTEAVQGIDSSDPTKSMQKYYEAAGGKKPPSNMPGASKGPTEPQTTLPVKYAKPDTSDLTLDVPVSGVVELKLVK